MAMDVFPHSRTKPNGSQYSRYPISSLIRKGNGTGVLSALAVVLHRPDDSPPPVDNQIKNGIITLLDTDPSLDKSILDLFTDASASAINSGFGAYVVDIASSLAELKNSGADEKICKLFTDASVLLINSGFGAYVDGIALGLAKLKNSGADEKISKLFTEASVLLINSGFGAYVGSIASGLAELKNSGADEKICKLFTDASVSAINSRNGHYVGSIASGLAFFKADIASIELENLSRRVSLLDTREFLSALADIIVRIELIDRSQGKPDRQLPEFLFIDQHPWSVFSELEKVKAAFKQTAEIMLGSIRRSRSSIHEAYSARKIFPPDSENSSQPHSQYDKFWAWLKVNNLETYAGNWKEEKFPGNGWSFNGFEPSTAVKNYVSAMTAWKPQVINPQEEINYQQAQKRSMSIFDDLAKSSIYKLRGALIIKPNSDNYQSAQGTEQYSCIFYNDHHDNLANATSIMIPTKVLEEEIAKSGGLNNLKSELLVKHPEALVFSSNSVFGGGLTNARQPKSSPLFRWESERQNETQDIAGHVHKSHILGGYSTNWNRLGPELEKFRQDHLNIYEIMNRFQTMTYQLDILESLHVKGYSNDTLDTEETFASFEESPEEQVPDITQNAIRLCEAWKSYISSHPPDKSAHSPLIVDASVFDKDTIVADWTIAYDPYNDKYYKSRNGVPERITLKEQVEFQWSKRLKESDRTIRVLPLSSVQFNNKENK